MDPSAPLSETIRVITTAIAQTKPRNLENCALAWGQNRQMTSQWAPIAIEWSSDAVDRIDAAVSCDADVVARAVNRPAEPDEPDSSHFMKWSSGLIVKRTNDAIAGVDEISIEDSALAHANWVLVFKAKDAAGVRTEIVLRALVAASRVAQEIIWQLSERERNLLI